MSQRTSEQRRADLAYRLITPIRQEGWREGYGRFAHKLPILVRTHGPVAALEFLRTRADRPEARALLKHLADQLREAGLLHTQRPGDEEELLAQLRKAPLAEYLRWTRELLAVLNWHKRLSVSVLDVAPGSDD